MDLLSMSQFKDFEGEFHPVKQYKAEEIKSDQFLSRIRLQKRAPRVPISTTTQIDETKTSSLTRPKLKISGIEEFKQRLENRNKGVSSEIQPVKRSRLMLVGTDEFQKLMAAKNKRMEQCQTTKPQSQAAQKKPRILLAGTNEFRDLLQKKEQLKELKRKMAVSKENTPMSKQMGAEVNVLPEETDDLKTTNSKNSPEVALAKVLSSQIYKIVLAHEIAPQSSTLQNEESVDQSKEEMHLDDENVEYIQQENDGNGKQPTDQNISTNTGTNDASEPGGLASAAELELAIEEYDKNDVTIFVQEDVDLMRRTILSQLTGQSFPQIENSLLRGPFEQVYEILEHTVRDFEGHSSLLIGPRGSGKTLILNKAIDSLKVKYSDLFITIKLNASLHSDDKIALREIARQLDLNSNKFDATGGETTTFEQRAISDTFTNILLTLDSNAPGREYDEERDRPTPVIIIIDEIEKFTSNTKQTLLYNIFDLSQSSKIPITVIGVSTMITTRELLEKRVRSRFSQRIIDITRAGSMEQFWNNAKLNLTVAPKHFSAFHNKCYPEQWNDYIENLSSFPSHLKKILFKIFFTTKNYKDVNNCGLLPVKNITCTQPFPRDDDFETYINNIAPNYAQAAIAALSNLELLLAIAAARWVERVDVPHVNFNLAYKEYTDMMKSFNREATTLSSSASFIDNTVLASIKVSQKIWSPKVLRDCWANLYNMGLLFDVITTNNEVNGNNNFNMYKQMVIEDSKMLQLDISLEDLGSLIDSSAPLKKLTRL